MIVPDPTYAAIERSLAATAAHVAALQGLDEDDDAQMRRANAAADHDTAMFAAVAAVTPTTMGGLHALLRFYAEHYEAYESNSAAGGQFARLADLFRGCDPSAPLLIATPPRPDGSRRHQGLGVAAFGALFVAGSVETGDLLFLAVGLGLALCGGYDWLSWRWREAADA